MDGFVFTLDRTDARPLAAQLVAGVRQAILTGRLRPHDRLPSTRALAQKLGVSRGVVVAAYDQLSGEGYIETVPGSPVRVAPTPHVGGAPRARNPAADAPAEAVRINLVPGLPSTARLDLRAWRSAWRRAASAPLPMEEAPLFGTDALRTQIADHVRTARGVACDAGDIVVTAGTREAVALLTHALRVLHPTGVAIAVEDPGYPAARRTVLRSGGTAVPVPVDADGMRLDALTTIAPPPQAVILTPSHHYPLGGRLPVSARLDVLAWAARTGALVIEDDYDSEFRHAGAPLPALASLDHGDCVALVGSFSKVLSPWLRVGYIVLPRRSDIRAAVSEVRADVGCPVPGIAQEALALLLAGGALRRHIAAVRRDYAHRRRLVLAALADLPGARLSALDGGLHAVVELPPQRAIRVLAELASAGIAVADLSDYAADPPEGRAGLVFGYAAPSDTALTEALAAIRAAIRRSSSAEGDLP